MRSFISIQVIVLLVVALAKTQAGAQTVNSFQTFTVQEPAFSDRTVRITEFGAIPDGKTLNTDAFAKAIDAVAGKGGGTIVVPPGFWLTGAIKLKSNINLHLEAGSLIQFSSDYQQYPLVVLNMKGEKEVTSISPISGERLENVAITGQGIIDGGGSAWRPVKKNKLTESKWNELVNSGGVLNDKGNTWWPSRDAMEGGALVAKLKQTKSLNPSDYEAAHLYLRPSLFKLIECRRLLLDGVTFQNSPAWHLNPALCQDVTLRNVIVRAPYTAQNSDALDIESCRSVVVRDSRFDVGDDCICLKSGIGEAGRRMGVPTENVLIENCVVYHGHGGFTIGSEMSGGIRNVRINNCLFMGTDIGLRFKSTRGRGGVVEKIYVSNIQMVDILGEAISFSMFYGGKAPLEAGAQTADPELPKVNEGTPQFRDFYLENITCRGATAAMVLRGLPEMPIRDIHLKNVSITAMSGMEWWDTDNIHLDNVEILNTKGPVLSVTHTNDSSIDRLSYHGGIEAIVSVKGRDNRGITIRDTDMTKAARGITTSGGADVNAITTK